MTNRPKELLAPPLRYLGFEPPGSGTGAVPAMAWTSRRGALLVTEASASAGRRRRRFAVFPEGSWRHRVRQGLRDPVELEMPALRLGELLESCQVRETGGWCLRVAVPGAYRKATLCAFDRDERPARFAKMPAHEGAVASVTREARVLRRLAEDPDLSPYLPGHPRLRGGAAFPMLVTRAGPSRRAGRKLGGGVLEFLTRVYGTSVRYRHLHGSAPRERWRGLLDEIGGRSDGLGPVVAVAIDRVEAALAGTPLPMTLSHGDFVPWNVHQNSHTCVFDWENSRDVVVAGYDALHYETFPSVLRRRPVRGPPRRAVAWMRQMWPEASGFVQEVWLCYLVELSLYYLAARHRRPDEGDDTVVRAAEAAIRSALQ